MLYLRIVAELAAEALAVALWAAFLAVVAILAIGMQQGILQ